MSKRINNMLFRDMKYWIILIYLLQLFGFIFSHGFYSTTELFLLLFSTVFMAIIYFSKGRGKPLLLKRNLLNNLKIVLILSITLSIILYGGLYQTDIRLVNLSFILLFFSLFLAISYTADLKNIFLLKQKRYFLLLLIAVLLRVFMVLSSPHPKIDVFDQLKLASNAFLNGKNPYELIFTRIYSQQNLNYYGYLPLSFILIAPIVHFFGDPRIAIITVDIILSLIIYAIARKKTDITYAELLSLIILYIPTSLYFLEQSYLDSILFLFFALFFYFYDFHKSNDFVIGILLGFAFSFKQYFYAVLLLPSLIRLGVKRRILFIAIIVFSLSIIPFLLLDQMEFTQDTFIHVLSLALTKPRFDSLSFNSFWHYTFGSELNYVVIIPAFIMFWLLLLKRQKQGSIISSLQSLFLSYQVFFLINRYAFLNYYHFTSYFIILMLAY